MDSKPLTFKMFKKGYALVWLILVVGLVLSWTLFKTIQHQQKMHHDQTFFWLAQERYNAVQNRLIGEMDVLEDMAVFLAGSNGATAEIFSQYSTKQLQHHSGVHTIAWIQPTLLSPQHDDSTPLKNSDHPTKFEIILQTARHKNKIVDWFTFRQVEAIMRACISGQKSAGLAIRLPDNTLALPIFLPLYRGGGIPNTAEERQHLFRGTLVALFQISKLAEESLNLFAKKPGGIDFWIQDESATTAKKELHFHPSRQKERPPLPSLDIPHSHKILHFSEKFWMADRVLIFIGRASDTFDPEELITQTPLMALFFGCLFTLLFTMHFFRLKQNLFQNQQKNQQLAEAKAYSDSILNSMGDSLLVLDPQGIIQHTNRSVYRLGGYEDHELRGQHISQLFAEGNPDTKATLWNPTSDINHEVQTSFQTKKGDLIPVRVSCANMKKGNPLISGTICVARDISLLKKTEEKLNHYQNHLEILVEERTQALKQAVEVAQLASRSKSTFIANTSHEFRTPMNAIMGLTDLALHSESPQHLKKHLAKIKKASQTLLRMINDILDLSKMESGSLELYPVPFKLEVLFDRLAGQFGPQAKEKNLALVFDLHVGRSFVLEGDVVRLEQVLINLIGNAIKFTKKGKINIGVRSIKETIDQVFFEFWVEDSGIGIDPTIKPLLFEPFTQADGSITRNYGGIGLGLSLSKHIIKTMGGNIQVKSQLQEGSLFSFSLDFPRVPEIHSISPQTEQEALIQREKETSLQVEQKSTMVTEQDDPQTITPLEEEPQTLDGARVLLVEDDEINQLVGQEMLQNLGLTVDIANNGQESLQKVAEESFDAVLMDIQMPVMDGLTATQHLRVENSFEDLPIIAMTGQSSKEDQELCLNSGMNDHISKPMEEDQLYETLHRWIVKSYNAPTQSQENHTLDLVEIEKLLKNLSHFLNAQDPEVETILSSLESHLKQSSDKEILKELAYHIDQYDFDEASTLTQTLAQRLGIVLNGNLSR